MVKPVVQISNNIIGVTYGSSKCTLYETWRNGNRIYQVGVVDGVETSDSTFSSFLEAVRALLTFMHVVENRAVDDKAILGAALNCSGETPNAELSGASQLAGAASRSNAELGDEDW